jgi:predicted nucleic acid-binding protein
MLVVADSSPLIVLIKIGQIVVLPKLFEQVVIPPEVSGG